MSSTKSNVVIEQERVITDVDVINLSLQLLKTPKMFFYFVKQGCFGENTKVAVDVFNAEYTKYKQDPEGALSRLVVAMEQMNAEQN
jgi:hypothetical protein